MSEMVGSVNGATEFQTKVLEATKPVLVDFWAPWCGPCRSVAPEVEAVAATYAEKAIIVKVNVDENQDLAARYKVMGVPTLMVFKNGVEVDRIVGYRPRQAIGAMLDKAL